MPSPIVIGQTLYAKVYVRGRSALRNFTLRHIYLFSLQIQGINPVSSRDELFYSSYVLVIMPSRALLFLLILQTAITRALAGPSQCYFTNGTETDSTFKPCFPDEPNSACCVLQQAQRRAERHLSGKRALLFPGYRV